MISWMQKHNKYLVWTIWVATIAFIGAGFVGWGSYNFSSGAGAVAKVGDIEIKQSKLNMVYSNLYSRYSELYKGNFDDEKAKELGLIKQAFATVETQAKLLNYAKELGVIVTDEELAAELASIQGFQKDGHFDKSIYQAYLQSRRLTAKTFETALREDLIIKKMLKLFRIDPLAFEVETIQSALGASDKIAYSLLRLQDLDIPLNDEAVKKYWESNKEKYVSPRKCKVEILWSDTKNVNVTEDELKNYYETNSFNYVDKSGKTLSFDEAKAQVKRDLQIQKAKKDAQKAYIAYKKGQKNASETATLRINDPRLSKDIWSEIELKNEGDIIKPKVVNDRYATVKILSFIKPKQMTFQEAKPYANRDYLQSASSQKLMELAKARLETIDKSNASVTDFISLNHFDNIEGLNSQESLQFVQKLFTSSEEKGMIVLSDKIVVYKIVAQKFDKGDSALEKIAHSTTATVKDKVYQSNLLKLLDTKYTTELYRGGLKGE